MKKKPDFSSIESRRSSASTRRLSAMRRLYYWLGLPVLRALIWLLTASYRYERVIGESNLQAFMDSDRACAPCFWHQQIIPFISQVRRWIDRGFSVCFVISASVDGDVPARMATRWGAEVVRGSANQKSGILALRDVQEMIKRGYSIVTAADGPNGPEHEVKAGLVLMARTGAMPIVPMAAAADRAWYLNRWDNFMIPKPFARIAVAIGEPVQIPENVPLNGIEPYRANVKQAVMSLMRDCENALSPA